MFSRNEDRVPLTGAGCFLRAVDRETRQYNDASHLSGLILRLGNTCNPDRFRKFFRELFRTVPQLSAPIRRPYGLGFPSYCVPHDLTSRGNIIGVHTPPELPDERTVPPEFSDRLNSTFDYGQGQLMGVDLIQGDNTAYLGLTWAHMLFDGYGIEVFMDRLSGAWERWVKTDRIAPHTFTDDTPSPLKERAAEYSWTERLQRTRDWSDHITSLTDDPPSSLSGPLEETQQDLEINVTVSDPDRTEAIDDRASSLGGHMRPMMFYLAVSMRAHYAVMRARGQSVSTLLVPVAVNMREGAPEPIYDTQVSFLWFTAGPDELNSLPELIDHLKEQRLEMIRQDFHEDTVLALETVKYCPTRIYRRFIRDPFDGEMASFFFSYTGEFLPDVDEFLGAEVELGLHTPGVPPSPGSGLIFSRHRRRLTMTHVHQEGVITEDERELFVQQAQADLRGSDDGVIDAES